MFLTESSTNKKANESMDMNKERPGGGNFRVGAIGVGSNAPTFSCIEKNATAVKSVRKTKGSGSDLPSFPSH